MTDLPEISVLIPNYAGHDALQLCLESVLRRTTYPAFRVVVLDSMADGRDALYLAQYGDHPKVEIVRDGVNYDHAGAIRRLLGLCKTEWAATLDSDCEILPGGLWLTDLVARLMTAKESDPRYIVVGRHRPGIITHDGQVITPTIWLAACLLDVAAYRLIEGPDDWRESTVTLEQFKGKWGVTPPANWDGKVGIETGYGFWEKMAFGNERGYKALDLEGDFFQRHVQHYGGMSRNHWRPEHPAVAPRWTTIRRRLAELRAEK